MFNLENFIGFLLVLGLALAKESQIKLEDIEHDTLKSEKEYQLPPKINQQLSPLPPLPPRQYYATPPPPPQNPFGPHLFSPEARQFPPPPPPPQQPYIIAPTQGHYLPQTIQNQYLAQFVAQPKISEEQQFQIQYITDNSLVQQPLVQQYYNQPQPQIVYLQPYVDSNTVLLQNPKILSQLKGKEEASHNLAALIQKTAYSNVLPLNYRQPAPQTYRVQGLATQPYVTQQVYVVPQPGPTNVQAPFQRVNQAIAQQRFLIPGIAYADQQPKNVEIQQAQQSTANVVYQKKEPQSLLDSYVPSLLQIQYYKQLQQQNNALPQDEKVTGNVDGKTDVVKLQESPRSDFNYQFSSFNE